MADPSWQPAGVHTTESNEREVQPIFPLLFFLSFSAIEAVPRGGLPAKDGKDDPDLVVY